MTRASLREYAAVQRDRYREATRAEKQTGGGRSTRTARAEDIATYIDPS